FEGSPSLFYFQRRRAATAGRSKRCVDVGQRSLAPIRDLKGFVPATSDCGKNCLQGGASFLGRIVVSKLPEGGHQVDKSSIGLTQPFSVFGEKGCELLQSASFERLIVGDQMTFRADCLPEGGSERSSRVSRLKREE